MQPYTSPVKLEELSAAEASELAELLQYYVNTNHAVPCPNGHRLRERRGKALAREPASLLQKRYAETRLHDAVTELMQLHRRRTALLMLRAVRHCELHAATPGWHLPDADYFGRTPSARITPPGVSEVIDLTKDEPDFSKVETLVLDGPLAQAWAPLAPAEGGQQMPTASGGLAGVAAAAAVKLETATAALGARERERAPQERTQGGAQQRKRTTAAAKGGPKAKRTRAPWDGDSSSDDDAGDGDGGDEDEGDDDEEMAVAPPRVEDAPADGADLGRLGSRVSMLCKPGNGGKPRWFGASVVFYDAASNMHIIKFDEDGEEIEVDLFGRRDAGQLRAETAAEAATSRAAAAKAAQKKAEAAQKVEAAKAAAAQEAAEHAAALAALSDGDAPDEEGLLDGSDGDDVGSDDDYEQPGQEKSGVVRQVAIADPKPRTLAPAADSLNVDPALLKKIVKIAVVAARQGGTPEGANAGRVLRQLVRLHELSLAKVQEVAAAHMASPAGGDDPLAAGAIYKVRVTAAPGSRAVCVKKQPWAMTVACAFARIYEVDTFTNNVKGREYTVSFYGLALNAMAAATSFTAVFNFAVRESARYKMRTPGVSLDVTRKCFRRGVASFVRTSADNAEKQAAVAAEAARKRAAELEAQAAAAAAAAAQAAAAAAQAKADEEATAARERAEQKAAAAAAACAAAAAAFVAPELAAADRAAARAAQTAEARATMQSERLDGDASDADADYGSFGGGAGGGGLFSGDDGMSSGWDDEEGDTATDDDADMSSPAATSPPGPPPAGLAGLAEKLDAQEAAVMEVNPLAMVLASDKSKLVVNAMKPILKIRKGRRFTATNRIHDKTAYELGFKAAQAHGIEDPRRRHMLE